MLIFSRHCLLSPAQFAVDILKGRGQNCPDVSHVDEHQRDPEQRVHDGHGLTQHGPGGQVAVSDGGEHGEREEEGGAQGPHPLPRQVAHIAGLDVGDDLLLVIQHQLGDPPPPLPGSEHIILRGHQPDVLREVLDCLKMRRYTFYIFAEP